MVTSPPRSNWLTAVLLTVFVGWQDVLADDVVAGSADGALAQTADRYLSILHDRPRPGIAFDRLYRHYLDAGRLDELIESLDGGAEPGDFAGQILLGLVKERRGDTDGAQAAYEAAEAADREQFVAPYALGMLHAREGRHAAAVECLSRAVARTTTIEESLDAHRQLARSYLRLDRRDEALAVLRTLADAFPETVRIQQRLAEFLESEGQFEESLQRWQQVAAIEERERGQSVDAHLAMANLRVRMEQPDAAVALLDETLGDVKPGSWLAETIWERLRRIFVESDDADGFAEYCRDRVARNPDDVDARLRQAQALANAGEREQSIEELRGVARRAPSRRDVQEELIHQLVVSGDIEAAVTSCEALVARNAEDADLWERLGGLHLRLESGDGEGARRAVTAWQRIAAIRPDDPIYAVRAADLCRQALVSAPGSADDQGADRGRELLASAAESLYREAVTRAPNPGEFYEYLGGFLHEQGRRDDAVDAFRAMAGGDDATGDDWLRLAEVYESFGYLAEAVVAIERALQQQADRFEWHVRRFDLLLRREEFDRADGAWHELGRLAATGEQQQIARDRRLLYLRLADRVDAEIERLQVLQRDETASATDMWMLALLLADRWRHEEARKAFEAARSLAPDNVPLLRDFAWSLEHGGDLRRAAGLVRRVIELDDRARLPDYEQLASLEMRIGDFESAGEAIAALRQLAPGRPATYVLLADLEFQRDAPEAGLAALRRAVQLAPREIAFRARLADELARHGAPLDATEHYWRCFELSGDPEEQRSLVSAICAIPSGRPELVIERLRKLREQSEDPRALTFCITTALRAIKQYDEARRELETIPLRDGPDLEVLRELTAIAAEQRAWSDAADYFSQIASVTQQVDDLRMLLGYYRKAERHDDATRVWEQLLASDNPEVYLDEVDRMLKAFDLDDAVSLAEIGLSKAPGEWRLEMRLAVAHLAAGRNDAAVRHFDAVAEAALSQSHVVPGAHAPAAQSGADPVQELTAARNYLRRFRSIRDVRQKQDRNWQDFLRRQLSSLPLPDSTDEAHVVALAGSYAIAEHRSIAEWIHQQQELGGADHRIWRRLIWAHAAADRLYVNKRFIDQYIAALPHDPLPHLARLRQERVPSSVQRMNSNERVADHDGLIDSYRWLLENRPALKPDYVFKFGSDMLLLEDDEEAVSAFIDTLQQHPSPDVRAKAAIALRHTGAAGLRALPHLVERLSDRSSHAAVESATTLGQMGPDAAPAIAPLIETFGGDDLNLRQTAALALGRIGPQSIPALTAVLTDEREDVRLGAALGLYHMGARASPALEELIRAIDDPSARVQVRAVMTLGHFKSEAAPAVPHLRRCLQRDDAAVLVATAETLTNIGPPARDAVPELLLLLKHDARRVQYAMANALRQIAPDVAEQHPGLPLDAVGRALEDIGTLDVRAGDWPQWGGWRGRNNTPLGTNIPAEWDVETGHNIKWRVPLGSQTFGNPSVANGKVFIGTNNEYGYLARFPKTIDLGVMLCFDEQTGSFLWQYSSQKLPTGLVNDWPSIGMPSTPLVDGERLWAVTNRCEVVCLDTEGFFDGENDGPYKVEVNQSTQEADVVWLFDMMGELGVSPHNMSTCCIITAGNKLFVCTSNGVDESHINIPAPQAPSFIALDRDTGTVLWTDNSPGTNILHGQWASPTYDVFGGQPQIVFPGGDGWLYSLDPEGDGQGGSKLLWKFDANPKEAQYSVRGRSTRNHMIGFACSYEGLLYFAVGEDPEHGEGDGHLWCIDPAHKTDGSDVSAELAVDAAGNLLPQRRIQAVNASAGERAVPNPDSAVVWHYSGHDLNGDGKLDYEENMHRGLSTPVIKDDLLYIPDFSGVVHCVDARTGISHWTYDMFSQSWGSALVVDDKVYVGSEEGLISVFGHSADPEVAMHKGPLARNDMGNSVFSTPIVANNVLFIANKNSLFAIAAPEGASPDE